MSFTAEELLAHLRDIERGSFESQRRAIIRDEALATVTIEELLEIQQIEGTQAMALRDLYARGVFSGDAWNVLTDQDMTA